MLRAKPGDTFYAIDGTGMKYRVVIETIKGQAIKGIVSNITRLENEPFHHVCLAMGICRPAKMDYIVEKGTEIGVSSFEFFYSEKSYAKTKEDLASARKISRLQRIIEAAVKQSKRTLIPQVSKFKTFAEILEISTDFDLALAATIGHNAKPLDDAVDKSRQLKKVIALVGPESGLTDHETEIAIARGFLPISMGTRRLRTETAGIVFPALILNHLGDL